MARFMYQARDARGEMTSGAVAAASIEEASKMLRAEGKFIIRLAPASSTAADEDPMTIEQHAKRVKRKDVIFFANQMAVMIETGVPLSDALECCIEQSYDEHFRAVLRDVTSQVTSGGEFSTVLKRYPMVFPPVMSSLIRASEVSGTMGQMLDRIARYLTKEQQIHKQVKGALMYPCFMLVMAVSVTIFLLAFVLPRFAAIYESRDATLPAPTRVLLGLSHALVNYWYAWVALAIGLAVGWAMMAKTAHGRRIADWLKLNIPVLKNLFTQLYVSRGCATMGTMIAAGVSILDMVAIVRHVTNNVYYEELWDQVDERIRQGAQLSDTLLNSTLIPRSIVQMIHSGEKSGRLGQVMNRVAEYTEAEFDTTVKTTTQFIEPLMVGVMGAVVGFVAISLLLPIFSIGKVVASG